MSDLRVDISNPTDRDYDRLDLSITVDDVMIRGQNQTTKIPGVNLLPSVHQVHINFVDENGKPSSERNPPVSSYDQIRIMCDRLPKKTSIGLILAVSDFTPKERQAMGSPRNRLYILTLPPPPFRLWMRKRTPSLRMAGDFAVLNRPHKLEAALSVKPL